MHLPSIRPAKWLRPQESKRWYSPIVAGNGVIPDQMFVDEARKAFTGEIIAGRDLLEI